MGLGTGKPKRALVVGGGVSSLARILCLALVTGTS